MITDGYLAENQLRHHAERKKYFMTFTKYCPFSFITITHY